MPLGPKPVLQGIGLLLGKAPDGRRATDGRIVMLNFFGPGGRNQLGQGLASKPGKRKINDVGIAKKIKKEGFDRLRRVGTAKLKENYSYPPCWVSHPPVVLAEGGCYSKSVGRVNEELLAGSREPVETRTFPVILSGVIASLREAFTESKDLYSSTDVSGESAGA